MVIPYFDGVYELPSVPIKYYYIVINDDTNNRLTYLSEVFPSPINCESDLPNVSLNCCKKYKFNLYVSFEAQTGDMSLDSALIKIRNINGCFIFDADPSHNK